MNKNPLLLFFLLSFSTFLVSCDKASDVLPGGSRNIKYEITGNYSGEITLVAATNNDDFEIIEIKTLPWTLEFIAKPSLKYVIVTAAGNSGLAGQKATMKTYVGGKEVASGSATALSTGYLSMSNKQYFLK